MGEMDTGLHGWFGAVRRCKDGGPFAVDARARGGVERNHPVVLLDGDVQALHMVTVRHTGWLGSCTCACKVA